MMSQRRSTNRKARRSIPPRTRPPLPVTVADLPPRSATSPSGAGALLAGYITDAPPVPAPTPARNRPSSGRALTSVDVDALPDTSLRAQVTAVSCAVVRDVEPQGLGVTYWFEARPSGEPYDLEVHFNGTQISGAPDAAAFAASRTISDVLPGVGTVAFTARFSDIAPGPWHVTASATQTTAGPASTTVPVTADGRTGFLPMVRELAPGVHPGAWPATVAIGAVLGVGLLLTLAGRYGIPVLPTLTLAILACVIGLVGAKVYFNLQSEERTPLLSTGGLCIQGFVIGAFATVIAGSLLLRLPAGSLLDLAAPGLMLGMLFGRVGCWAGGCCAGRPSRARLALWSSDRTLGVKRVPVQFIEGLLAAGIGAIALLFAWRALPSPPGALFIAVIAAYIAIRQLLFPLRSQARRTVRGRYLALLAAAVSLTVSMALLALSVAR